MDRRITCTSLLAATLFIGGTALAQQTGAGTSGSSGTPSSASDVAGAAAQTAGQEARSVLGMLDKDPDKRFVQMAAIGNLVEMRGAEIAQQKAQSPDVKQLAQQIQQDHQKSQQDIQETAQKIGVQIPQELPRMKQDEVQEFAQLQGDEFDKRYVSAVKAAHAASISKCSDEAKIAKNDDVKQLAQKLLPSLQAHGQMIGQCAQAQGLSMEGLAQPAGATIPPSGTSGGTSGTTGGGTSGSPGTTGGGTTGTETSK